MPGRFFYFLVYHVQQWEGSIMDQFFFLPGLEKRKRLENVESLNKMADRFMTKMIKCRKEHDDFNGRFYSDCLNQVKQAIRDNYQVA